MTGFDLIFLLCFLASVVTLATLGVQSLRRRPTARLRKRLLVGWLGYGLTLLGVSLFTPARSVDRGSPQCSDDWCLTLVGVTNAARADGREYTLQLNLTNRGHG
ncbi:MAG: hypothetical protein ABJF01_21955, partial [bacterium]